MSIASELYGKQKQLEQLIKNAQDKSSPQFLSDLSSHLSEMERFIQWPFKLDKRHTLDDQDFEGNNTYLRQMEMTQCRWYDKVEQARAVMESARALFPKLPEPTEADLKARAANEEYAKTFMAQVGNLKLQFWKFRSWYGAATDPKRYNDAFDSLKEKHQLLQEERERESYGHISDFQLGEYIEVIKNVRAYLEDNEKLRKQNEEKLAGAAAAQAAVAVPLDGGQPAAAAAGAGAGAQAAAVAPAVAPVLAFSGAANAAAIVAQAAGAAAAHVSPQDPKASLGGAKP